MSKYLKVKFRKLGQWVLIGATYFFLGKLGLLLAVVQSNATAIWAPTGVAIATFLFFGYDIWPAIFFAAFLTNITTGGTSVLVSLIIGAGNTLEGISAAWLVRKFANGIHAFSHPKDVLRFFLLAGAVSPIISATFGVTSLTLFGYSSWGNYIPTWTTWWVGDLSGAVIFAPLLLLWFDDHKIAWDPTRIPRFLFIVGLIVLSGFLIITNSIIFFYLSIPLFIWAAFHLKQREVAAGTFVLTEISLWGTLHGYGPFIRYEAGGLNPALLLLDAAMISMAITMMVLASVIEEDRNIRRILADEKIVDQAALASIGEGFIITNRELDIVFINPMAEAMLGMTASEAIGKKYSDVISEGSSLLATISEGRRIVNNPFEKLEYYTRKNGERFPVSYTKTPIMWNGAAIGVSEVFRDITKEMEIDKAKSEFISFASHQLRTPLSIVGLSSELLKGEGSLFGTRDDEEVASYVSDIQEATQQMNDIINNLLNVSRIESQTLQPLSETVVVEHILFKLIKAMAPQIKKKQLHVDTRFPRQASRCTTDPHILQIILQNLLSNAIKYTPERGTISLAVTQEKMHVVFVISDTGYGIPESEQENVFKKLYRARNIRGSGVDGSGLGLYIVKAMMDKLGGDISLASKEGQGTTFVVRIPVGKE